MGREVAIFGFGRQGRRIGEILKDHFGYNVVAYDLQKKEHDDIKVLQLDISSLSSEKLREIVKLYDLIIDSLPSSQSFFLIHETIGAGKNILSVSFIEEDYMLLDSFARENKAVFIPDCGAAPGFSHFLAGFSSSKIKNPLKVSIKVGAIPVKPVPPFYHNITWSVEDLLEEYVRKAKVRKGGKILYVEPFSEIKNEKIFGMELQSFYTDGVRSFFESFPEIPEVYEKTLRWKGHLEFMRVFKEVGFLERGSLNYNNTEVSKLKFFSKVIEEKFSTLPKEDLFVMEVRVEGEAQEHVHTYKIEYDYKSKMYALQNAVAITASFFSHLLLEEELNVCCGVYPLELLSNEKTYKKLINFHISVGKAEYKFKVNKRANNFQGSEDLEGEFQ